MGAVSGRAPVGHRARGLQHGRQRLGLLHPRPGPVARVPLGRGRPGRDLRRPAAPLLRARPVERRGSDPQGAPVRAHQQRGQPRRGRQGVLLLPRQHADALVHEVPLQVSAGRVSVRQIWSKTNRRRSRQEIGVRAARHRRLRRQDRYFDVFVEYAKASPEDILIQITVANRGPEPAALHVLPTLWFRNTWSWRGERPSRRCDGAGSARRSARSEPPTPSSVSAYLYCDRTRPLLFTENETNTERIFGEPNRARTSRTGSTTTSSTASGSGQPGPDGHQGGRPLSVHRGAGQSVTIRLRLGARLGAAAGRRAIRQTSTRSSQARRQEADEFYAAITPARVTSDDATRSCARRWPACSGASSSIYYDVEHWLERARRRSRATTRRRRRATATGTTWSTTTSSRCPTSGSIPGTRPGIWRSTPSRCHGRSGLRQAAAQPDAARAVPASRTGRSPPTSGTSATSTRPCTPGPPGSSTGTRRCSAARAISSSCKHTFQKLLLNFTWWVNRKDVSGSNVFEGGFLGLDNIGVFDRSAPLPTGGYLEQADGTAWMAFFCQMMLQIALELALDDPGVRGHRQPSSTSTSCGSSSRHGPRGRRQDELWDEEDGFFYDRPPAPGRHAIRLKVRSMVGLLALAPSTVLPADCRGPAAELRGAASRASCGATPTSRPTYHAGAAGLRTGGCSRSSTDDKLRRVSRRMLDRERVLEPDSGSGPVSGSIATTPTRSPGRRRGAFRVDYEPAESTAGCSAATRTGGDPSGSRSTS